MVKESTLFGAVDKLIGFSKTCVEFILKGSLKGCTKANWHTKWHADWRMPFLLIYLSLMTISYRIGNQILRCFLYDNTCCTTKNTCQIECHFDCQNEYQLGVNSMEYIESKTNWKRLTKTTQSSGIHTITIQFLIVIVVKTLVHFI